MSMFVSTNRGACSIHVHAELYVYVDALRGETVNCRKLIGRTNTTNAKMIVVQIYRRTEMTYIFKPFSLEDVDIVF